MNEPGLCPKDPPRAPEQDQPMQNKPTAEEHDNVWLTINDWTHVHLCQSAFYINLDINEL